MDVGGLVGVGVGIVFVAVGGCVVAVGWLVGAGVLLG